MAPADLLTILLIAALLGAGAALALTLRRARNGEAALSSCRALTASRGRALGLLARDLEGPGMALLGLASRLPLPESAAVDATARRILALADEVCDVLAVNAGPRRLDPVRLPLGPLLGEALEEVGLPLGPAGRHWRIAPEVRGAVLHADPRALKRVVFQVLARAARETRPADPITLRLAVGRDTASLIVEDEGAGLPAGELAAATGTRGVGLGLATARDLMRAHGGDLVLETAPGIGARTWITFPRSLLLDAEEPTPAPVPAALAA